MTHEEQRPTNECEQHQEDKDEQSVEKQLGELAQLTSSLRAEEKKRIERNRSFLFNIIWGAFAMFMFWGLFKQMDQMVECSKQKNVAIEQAVEQQLKDRVAAAVKLPAITLDQFAKQYPDGMSPIYGTFAQRFFFEEKAVFFTEGTHNSTWVIHFDEESFYFVQQQQSNSMKEIFDAWQKRTK